MAFKYIGRVLVMGPGPAAPPGEPWRLPPRSQTFGVRKWGVFTRLETRTKESNRRAREKILLPVLLSY